jgi:hypothetical protein
MIALLGLLALPQVSHAQAMTNGTVQAMIVQGNVDLITKDGTTTALKRGATFEEGSSVRAAKGANALLVLSNGATLKVKENTTLAVTHFQQAPFDKDAEGTYLRLTKDPSHSETTLNLSDGSLQGEVKKLDTTDGSKFTVDTPAGSAGIRGTIVDITIVRDSAGHVTQIIANCVVGAMGFTPSAANISTKTDSGSTTTVSNTQASTITGGGQIAIVFNVDPTTGVITGGTMTGATMSIAQSQSMANDLNTIVNQANVANGDPTVPAVTVPTTPATITITDTNGNTVNANLGRAVNPTPNTTSAATSPVISNPQNVTP